MMDYDKIKIKDGWMVIFAATMPYARRLEVAYHKSVLIKAMNWIDNEFLKNVGMTPVNQGWEYEFE